MSKPTCAVISRRFRDVRASERVEWWFFVSGRKPHLSGSHSQLSLLQVTDGCILVCSHQATSVNAFVSLTKSPFWKSHFPRLNPINSLVFSSVTIRLSNLGFSIQSYRRNYELFGQLNIKRVSKKKKKKVFILTSMQNSCLICFICLCLLKDSLDERICIPPWKKAHWKFSSC